MVQHEWNCTDAQPQNVELMSASLDMVMCGRYYNPEEAVVENGPTALACCVEQLGAA